MIGQPKFDRSIFDPLWLELSEMFSGITDIIQAGSYSRGVSLISDLDVLIRMTDSISSYDILKILQDKYRLYGYNENDFMKFYWGDYKLHVILFDDYNFITRLIQYRGPNGHHFEIFRLLRGAGYSTGRFTRVLKDNKPIKINSVSELNLLIGSDLSQEEYPEINK